MLFSSKFQLVLNVRLNAIFNLQILTQKDEKLAIHITEWMHLCWVLVCVRIAAFVSKCWMTNFRFTSLKTHGIWSVPTFVQRLKEIVSLVVELCWSLVSYIDIVPSSRWPLQNCRTATSLMMVGLVPVLLLRAGGEPWQNLQVPAPGGWSWRRRRYPTIAKQILPITQHFYTFFFKVSFRWQQPKTSSAHRSHLLDIQLSRSILFTTY